jgi:hypothetical protein
MKWLVTFLLESRSSFTFDMRWTDTFSSCLQKISFSNILSFHSCLWYKKPVCTSQETHYVSTTESSQLMLCKIWGFYGNDYEECRLLGYNYRVLTSEKTHYVSVTEPSRLMLHNIWSSHGWSYEECRLLGYKNQVHTSKETHYVAATEPIRLISCKIYCV